MSGEVHFFMAKMKIRSIKTGIKEFKYRICSSSQFWGMNSKVFLFLV